MKTSKCSALQGSSCHWAKAEGLYLLLTPADLSEQVSRVKAWDLARWLFFMFEKETLLYGFKLY